MNFSAITTQSRFAQTRTMPDRSSVMWRSGRRAGIHGLSPNPYSIANELYHKGYVRGVMVRMTVQVTLLLGSAACSGFLGYALFVG